MCVFFPSLQVEAKIVEEEYEDGNRCASSCKASLRDSDDSSTQRSSTTDSGKNVSTLIISLIQLVFHIQFIFTLLLCPIFSFPFGLGHIKNGLTSNYGNDHFHNCNRVT